MTAAVTEPAAIDPADGPPPSWTRIFTIASYALAAVALVATVWSVGPHRLLAQLEAIGLGFAAVVALEVVITGFDSAALSGFLGSGGRRSSFLQVVRAQVAGRAINSVTPLASLGEATKATTLMEHTPSRRAIAAVFHYNLATIGVRMATIVVGAPICAVVLDLPHLLVVALYAGSAVAAAVLLGGILLIRRGMLVSLVDAGRAARLLSQDRAVRWRTQVAAIDRYHPRYGADPLAPWKAVLWILISRALSLASGWVVLRSVGYSAGPGTVAAIATAGTLIGTISSVVPMGLGISEGSNAALFAALGVPSSLGVTMVLGGRITLLAYAALGVVLGASTVVVKGAQKVRTRRLRGRRRRDAALLQSQVADLASTP